MATKPITIKIEEDLLEAIKQQAAIEHLPYQTWIKQVIARELDRAKRRVRR
jgi:predicted DNA binding CopG/RHH family protein